MLKLNHLIILNDENLSDADMLALCIKKYKRGAIALSDLIAAQEWYDFKKSMETY